MNLRSKFLFLILGFLLLQLSIFGGFYHLVLLPQLNNHDKANAEKNINMGFSFFQYQLNGLKAGALLWANEVKKLEKQGTTQDLNQLISAPLNKYTKENINFLILLDEQKQPLLQKSFDPYSQKAFPLDEILKQFSQTKLQITELANETYSGFFISSRGPALIIIHPFLQDNNQPSRYLITGQLITEKLIHDLNLRLKTQLEIRPLNTDIVGEKQKSILSLIKANETKVHYETQEENLVSYKMIPNIDDKPNIVLASTTPRTAYLFIKRIFKESYGLLLAANFILILMLLKIMNETIIGPIRQISEQLALAEDKINNIPPIGIRSNDEIGELSNKVNSVLIKLERNRNEAMGRSYQAGTQNMRAEMLNDIAKLTAPAVRSVDAIEKALNHLPMNALEKISAEFSNHTNLNESQKKLSNQLSSLNSALRESLKAIRLEAREAHTKIVRISTTIRTHAITLGKPKSFTLRNSSVKNQDECKP